MLNSLYLDSFYFFTPHVKGKYKVILLFFNLYSQGANTVNFAPFALGNKDQVVPMWLTHTRSHQDVCSWLVKVHSFHGAKKGKRLWLALLLHKCWSSHWEIGINLPKYCQSH